MVGGPARNSATVASDASNDTLARSTTTGSPSNRTRPSACLTPGSSVERTVSNTRSIAVKPVSCHPGVGPGTASDCATSAWTRRRSVGFVIASVAGAPSGSVAATHGRSVNVTVSVTGLVLSSTGSVAVSCPTGRPSAS